MRCRGIIHRVITMFDALDKAQALLAEKLEPVELWEISRHNKKRFVFQETFTQILVDITKRNGKFEPKGKMIVVLAVLIELYWVSKLRSPTSLLSWAEKLGKSPPFHFNLPLISHTQFQIKRKVDPIAISAISKLRKNVVCNSPLLCG